VTFSIVARCAATGQFGIAISSSSPAVAARCAHVRAGVGAVASQNITNPALGVAVLDQLAVRQSAQHAVSAAVAAEPFPDFRQVLAIDPSGNVAEHSGSGVLGTWATARGIDCIAGGNLLANEGVPHAMVNAFVDTDGGLGHRLLAALAAGESAGGEAGPVHSAGLLLADQLSWPYVDLRVDWDEAGDPIGALHQVWAVYEPQADAYVQRAIAPGGAPSFGVPGSDGSLPHR
jgi:uncharacterized Ntn-hydrolase superfamily protein